MLMMETEDSLVLNEVDLSIERKPDLTINPFKFKGYGTFDSKCKVDIWYNKDELKAIVLFSDLGNDSGTSITNAAETIVTKVWNDWLRAYPKENCLFIETYSKKEGISLIVPDWDKHNVQNVSWKYIGKIVEQK